MKDFPVFVEIQDLKIWGWKDTSKGSVYPPSPRESLVSDQPHQLVSWGTRCLFQAGVTHCFPGRSHLFTVTRVHSQKGGGASLERQHTCAKYSSEILPAHSIHRSRGRHGLATSAHLIIMRLIRIWFSGKFFPIGLHSQSLPSIWKTDGHIRVVSIWWWSPQGPADQILDGSHPGKLRHETWWRRSSHP